MTTVQIGQVLLDQFRVEAFLSAGGMGAVYKVWDLKRQVPLAMKVLHADLAEDPHILKRFRREANALKKLTHPNIVSFYGMYQTLDFVFLLEAYIDGPTLKEVLKRKGRLSVEEALVVLKGVSAALSYAHVHGVVHCDVKPGNIMLDSGGRVYLTDFGIVRHAESTTTTIAFAGTAAYMAPEQIQGQPVTPATDVYALGVVAYELLTGRRPFTGEEWGTASTATRAERLRMAHIKLPPPDPRSFHPDLPEAAGQVLLRALNKAPEQRFSDAWAFFQSLCQALGTEPESIPDRLRTDILDFYLDISAHSERVSLAEASRRANGTLKLEVREVVKNFGGLQALKGVSLTIEGSQLVGLIGPNGAGKTTLTNIISGLLRPTSGQIWFNGERIDTLRPYHIARKGIGRTFQVTRAFRRMTVLENMLAPGIVKHPYMSRRELEKKALEIMEFLTIDHLRYERAGNLSGGQQKLLELARLLMLDPQLIILDEPFAGVHPKLQRTIYDYIKRVREQGKAIILISHDMESIFTLSERLVVLNFGEIIADGPPEEVKNDPAVIEAYLGRDEEEEHDLRRAY